MFLSFQFLFLYLCLYSREYKHRYKYPNLLECLISKLPNNQQIIYKQYWTFSIFLYKILNSFKFIFKNKIENKINIPAYLPAGRQGSVGRISVIIINMYYVYILQSLKNLNYYTGLTKNIKRRLQEHNSKQTKSNKDYAPFKIVYIEKFKTISEARAREKFFKTGTGREFRDKILN